MTTPTYSSSVSDSAHVSTTEPEHDHESLLRRTQPQRQYDEAEEQEQREQEAQQQQQQDPEAAVVVDVEQVAGILGPGGGGRPSSMVVRRRRSFWMEFVSTPAAPQICFLMMLIAIGLGCTIGVIPAVMTDRFARLNHGYQGTEPCLSSSSTSQHQQPQQQACWLGSADAQTAAASSNLISNVLTFVTSSYMGSLSDCYGRKSILIVGLALTTLPPLCLCAIQLVPYMSPWWYYTASSLTGCVNWTAVALSSLSDVLPPKWRAPGIGLLLAGFMLGFSLSPILALLLNNLQLSLVSVTVVACGFGSTVLWVPETLPPALAAEARRTRRNLRMQQQQQQQQQQHSQTHKVLSTLTNALCRPFQEMAILNRNSFFRLISLLAFFSGMVASGDQVLLIYYLEERLGFTTQDVSVMFLIMGITGLLAQAVLLKPINDLLGEKRVVALAFFCGAIDNAMYGLAKHKGTVYAAVAVAGLTGMAFPTISAIKANNVHETEQGRIQGALYSLQALAAGLGPVALKFVYSQTKDGPLGPGSMFLFASGLYLVAVMIACSLPSDKANARRCTTDSASSNIHPTNPMEEEHIPAELDEYIQLASASDTSSSASLSSTSREEDYYGSIDRTVQMDHQNRHR